MLTITDSVENGIVVVRPSGRLDTLTARTFESHVQPHIDGSEGPLLLDMACVDYVSSFGLRSILIVTKKLSPFGRKLVLFSVNPSVREVLRVAGFTKIMTIAEDETAAFAAVTGEGG